jgi:hypothetical protein
MVVKRMRLLFEDLAKKHFSPARVKKLKRWVEHADKARKSQNLNSLANQYDKAEELITFYAFAPIEIRGDEQDLVNDILRLAGVNETVESVNGVGFEKLFKPSEGYLSWMENEVRSHPIKYVREQAKDHKIRKRPLETDTHVDALVETESLLIFVEVKFTSDIAVGTTFNPERNQLARLIDVGISAAIEKGKKLVLLLCSPSMFFVKKSRFYSYKITEYSNYEEMQRDICWRKQHEIEKYVSAVTWVPLESLIKIIYQDFNHPDVEEALEFFKERNLA